MKRLIICLLLFLPVIAYSQKPETRCGFSDDITVNFLGLSFLVASHYEYFQTWPSTVNDLLKLKNKIPDTEEVVEIIKSRFKNLKFNTINGESNIQLSYIKKDGSEISGTLIIPPMEDADQMIQHMRAEGDLKELADR